MNKKWNRKACQQENQPGEKKLLINEKRDRKACRQEKGNSGKLSGGWTKNS